MRVGFTGTQLGMTGYQLREVSRHLKALKNKGAHEFHHGDCVGADAEADKIALDLGYTIFVHPPEDPSKRAFCTGGLRVILPKAPYLVRNRSIVDHTEVLIATPKRLSEELRSGTWATIRYARKLRKDILLITPNEALGTGQNPAAR